MIRTDNPAGRLHQIFTKAQAVERSSYGYEFWANVFDIPFKSESTVDPEVEIKIANRLVQLRKLIDETEYSLKKIEGLDLELYLKPFTRLRYVVRLGHLHNNNPVALIMQITEGDMTVVAFCAAKLAELPPEPTIAEEYLTELLEDVNALYEQVLLSTLDSNLKTLILEQLQGIRTAVHEYHIRGIARLREELEKNIGVLVVNEELIKQSGNEEEVKKYGRIVSNLATHISIASNLSKLAESVVKYFPL